MGRLHGRLLHAGMTISFYSADTDKSFYVHGRLWFRCTYRTLENYLASPMLALHTCALGLDDTLAPCQNRVLELEQLETDWPVSFQLPLTRLEERNARCKQETRPPASQVGGGAGRCFGQVCGFLNACVVMLWRQWGLFCMHVVCSFAVVIAPMAPEGRQIGP